MTYDIDGHFDDWRWSQFKELVSKHGGTVVARVGNRVKVRFGEDVMWLEYTGGGDAGCG